MQVRLWAMKTSPFVGDEASRLLAALPLTVQERLTEGGKLRADSLWAYSLLRFAVLESFDMELPEISCTDAGKPYFTECSEICFSISHTEGAVLVGLWDREIGVDIEKDRPAPERVRRLLQAEKSFFSEWVRYEACAKCAEQSVLSLLRAGALPENVTCRAMTIFSEYEACAAVQGEGAEPTLSYVEEEQLLAGC